MTFAAMLLADRVLRNPITGIAGCCACATSGHAIAAPPIDLMNSRRCMGCPQMRQSSTSSEDEGACASRRSSLAYVGSGSTAPFRAWCRVLPLCPNQRTLSQADRLAERCHFRTQLQPPAGINLGFFGHGLNNIEQSAIYWRYKKSGRPAGGDSDLRHQNRESLSSYFEIAALAGRNLRAHHRTNSNPDGQHHRTGVDP